MKNIIWIYLLTVGTATYDTVTALENYISPSEYSKVNQEVYKANAAPVTPITPKTPNYTIPPHLKLPPVAFRTVPASAYDVPPTKPLNKESYSKPVAIKAAPPPPVVHKPTPLIRQIEEVTPIPHKIYSVPKNIVRTYSAADESEDTDTDVYNKEYSDPEEGPGVYQQEEYPAVPIGPTYAPPIAVYNPYPAAIQRRYFTPPYRNRIYPRLYSIVPPVYRTLGYGGPLPYPVPSVAYGYPTQPGAVRYDYSSRNVGYDDEIPEIRYNGFINSDYDDYLRKKKK